MASMFCNTDEQGSSLDGGNDFYVKILLFYSLLCESTDVS
jgi:hypothetical protein